MIFKYRHFVFSIIIGLLFLSLFRLGETIIPDKQLFPLGRSNFFGYYTPVGFVTMFIIHMALAFYTKLRFSLTKDPRENGGEDTEVESIITKYKKFVKRRVKDDQDSFVGNFHSFSSRYQSKRNC